MWRLHPCNTADVMAIVRDTGALPSAKTVGHVLYMETFLSLLGPLVGIRFSKIKHVEKVGEE